MNRAISREFMAALLKGKLKTIMNIIKNDISLDLELRGKEVVVYYKGLKILTIEQRDGDFKFIELDQEYRRRKKDWSQFYRHGIVKKPMIISCKSKQLLIHMT